jgi:hypothetical protein
MRKLSTFQMEALIEDPNLWKSPHWLEVLDFKFHTTGEYPMVSVWIPNMKVLCKSQTYSFLSVKGFRIKKEK